MRAVALLLGVVATSPGVPAEAGIPTNCGLLDGTTSPFAGGTGYSASPYQVATATQLAAITGDLLDCDYIQTASLTLSAPWTPIGSSADVFRGVYDGDGFSISGLSIPAGDDYLGLFGATNSAVIMDVTLNGVSVAGDRYVGGLVGSAQATTISNVTVSGAVSGNLRVGGIAGDLKNDAAGSLLSNGQSSVTVTAGAAPLSQFGGVVGFVYESTISRSGATGSVTGTSEVGGIAGEVGSGSIVSYSRATGAVSGTSLVGGLVGYLWSSSVNDSYAAGSVTATDGSAGGVAGYVERFDPPLIGPTVSAADLERTYATGAVSGTDATGGLTGFLDSYGVILASHWSTTANSTLNGIGVNISTITTVDPPGSSLIVLQDIDTYSDWTITNGWTAFAAPTSVWGICDGDGTPYLLWEETESPCDGAWTVTGFFAPVDMGDVLNVAQAGRVVPLKWRIVDADGVPVSDPDSFVKIGSSRFSCPGSVGTVEDGVENYVGNSGMRYLGDGYWQFNWATLKSYAGQCRTVTLELSDGTTISADFRFRR